MTSIRWIRASAVAVALSSFVFLSGCGAAAESSEDIHADIASSQAALSTRPDESQTPGALCSSSNKDFDGYRYPEHIAHCQRNVSTATKRAIKNAYGIPTSQQGNYEIDHRIPLSIGGSNDRKNLWPLYEPDARRKSQLEQDLFDRLSTGEITQASAIQQMLDWQ